jgi:hypothetical protein
VLGTVIKHNLNKNKKNNFKVTRAKFLSMATILVIAIVTASTTLPLTAQASRFRGGEGEEGFTVDVPDAPVVVSGENIYIAWWTNNTENGNEEVMFRASIDGGATFGDKINLSNTTDADSNRVEISGEGETVVVSWWETNQTSDIPVARISTDAGETFGPMLRLGANGTIGVTEEEGAEAAAAAEGEGGEEEAAAANGGGE